MSAPSHASVPVEAAPAGRKRRLRQAAIVLATILVLGGVVTIYDANHRWAARVDELVRSGRFLSDTESRLVRIERASRLLDPDSHGVPGTTATRLNREELDAAWQRVSVDLKDLRERGVQSAVPIASAVTRHVEGLSQQAGTLHDLGGALLDALDAEQLEAVAGHQATIGRAQATLVEGFTDLRTTLQAVYAADLARLDQSLASWNRVRVTATAAFLAGLALLSGLSWSAVRRRRLDAAVRTARVERALEAEARYNQVLHRLPVGIFQTDPQGRCIHTSGAWDAITSGTCATGDHWLTALHPDDRAAAALDLTTGSAGDGPRIYRLDTPDAARWGSFRIAPLGDNERLDGYIGIVSDVTDLQRQQDLARDSIKRLEDLKFALDQHCIVTVSDPQGNIQQANEKFCAITGHLAEDVVGRNHSLVNSGHHTREFMQTMWTTIGRGDVWKGEFRNRAKDGSLYWVDTTIVPFLDDQGKPYQYISIRTDVTAHHRAEEALRRSSRMQAAILDSAAHGIVVADGQGTVTGLNRAALALLGRPGPEVVGTGVIHRFLRPATAVAEAVARANREGTTRADLLLERANGREIPVSVTLTRFENDDLHGDGYLATIVDITDRIRVEQELKTALTMQADFVSLVSHQLRTPLTGIRWMLELAQQGEALDAAVRAHLVDAQGSTDRLLMLVNQLLSTARIEQGRIEIQNEPVDLGDLSRSVGRELEPLARERGQTLRLDVDDPPPLLVGDAALVREVLLNLVSNAIKYSTDPATIVIRAGRPADGGVRWSVTDHGIGIPASARTRIFEKFFRAENACTAHTEGTGLGLHFVSLVMSRHQGEVGCDSEEGRGSTFFIRFPPRRVARERDARSRSGPVRGTATAPATSGA